jgi:predicted nucleic acid-binding protein
MNQEKNSFNLLEVIKDNKKINDLVIILDTNVWIDFSIRSEKEIEEINKILSNYRSNIAVPFQVYEEFNKNMGNKFEEFFNKNKKLEKDKKEIEDKINDFTKKYFKKDEKIKDLNKKLIEIMDEKLSKEKEKFEKKKKIFKEKIESIYCEIFKNQKYKNFKINDFINIFLEGEKRYKFGISPGFTDYEKLKKEEKKNINEKTFSEYKVVFGDLIIWKEILLNISKNKKYVLLIQNEKKNDWWENFTKRSINKVLISEFNEYCSDSKFKMINFDDFLKDIGVIPNIDTNNLKEILDLKETVKEKLNKNKEFEKLVIEHFFDDTTKLESYLENGEFITDFGSAFNIEIYDYSNIEKFDILSINLDFLNNSAIFNINFECVIRLNAENYGNNSLDITDAYKSELEINLDFIVRFEDDTGVISKIDTYNEDNLYDYENKIELNNVNVLSVISSDNMKFNFFFNS